LFSKFVWAIPLKSKKAAGVAAGMKEIFDDFGFPDKLHTDNGKEFRGALEELCKLAQIPLVHGGPYSPNVQGGDERWNQTARL